MAVPPRPPRSVPAKRGSSPGRPNPAARAASGAGSATPRPTPRKAPAKKAAAKKTAAKKAPARKPATGKNVVRGFAHGGASGRSARGSVSLTSAQRFAARARARRRRRVLIVVGVVLVINALAWAAFKSPWATVRAIEVTGTDRVSPDAVRAEAEPELGHPILLARTKDILERVGRERLIRSVTVERTWPSTIRIEVVEREPVAALPTGSGGLLSLVDRDGVEIEQVKVSPAGMPRLEVDRGPDGVPALRGCLEVLKDLPPAVTKRLLSIGADSPNGIWLKLKDPKVRGGARVEWGDSKQTPRKAEVLTVLLPKHAKSYDVRSPDTPAIRGN